MKPGYYRFFVPDHMLETHAHPFLGFLAASGLLPVRIEPDYCQRGQSYVVQCGKDRPTETLIRDTFLVWHSAECKFSILIKPSPRPITPDELAVIDVARRIVYQSGANLRTIARNIDHLGDAICKLPDVSPPIEG